MRKLLPRTISEELAYAAGTMGLVAGGLNAVYDPAMIAGSGVAFGFWLSAFYLWMRGL